MVKSISKISFLLFCVYMSTQCTQEPNLPKPLNIPLSINPCDTALKTKFKADFDIYEGLLGLNDTIIEVPTDTISVFSFKVKAKGSYDGYEWHIGEDDRVFRTPTVTLSLPYSTINSKIKVKLIAKKGGVLCTTIPAQVDSIEKSFVVAMPPNDLASDRFKSKYVQAICGTWEGVTDDEPNKKFSVRIVNTGNTIQEQALSFYGVYLYNLPEGCGGPAYNISTEDPKRGCGGVRVDAKDFAPRLIVGHNSIYIIRPQGISSCCPNMQLMGRLDPNDRNKIIIDLVTNPTIWGSTVITSVTRRTTFRGKRM
jgi:hypothetical protein